MSNYYSGLDPKRSVVKSSSLTFVETDPTVRLRDLSKSEKKQHKRNVKEQNREKRKTKVPKAVKKRKEKLIKLHKWKKS
mgnify:CR=1 FL=1